MLSDLVEVQLGAAARKSKVYAVRLRIFNRPERYRHGTMCAGRGAAPCYTEWLAAAIFSGNYRKRIYG